MKNQFCLFVAAIWFIYPQAQSLAQDWTGNVNLSLGGEKSLDEDDWAPIEDQDEMGILVDFKKNSWPLSLAMDFLQSEDSKLALDPLSGLLFSLSGKTREVNLGVRKIWEDTSSARFYVGGGIAHISMEVGASLLGVSQSEQDDAVGLWANGGVYFTLGHAFNVGLDLRYSNAKVTFFGVEGEAGGRHMGLLVGYHW